MAPIVPSYFSPSFEWTPYKPRPDILAYDFFALSFPFSHKKTGRPSLNSPIRTTLLYEFITKLLYRCARSCHNHTLDTKLYPDVSPLEDPNKNPFR